MHIERILHSQGFGTRKSCRTLIRAGRVSIAGRIIDNPFEDIPTAGLVFSVNDTSWQYFEKAYLMLHKPAGYECSHRTQNHSSVFELLPPELTQRGVQCIGRLDQDTTGLLLLSDDGQFIHTWSSGKKRNPKVYEVTTKHPVTDLQIGSLLAGVQLHDEPAPITAVACTQTGERSLSLTIAEGKYHQVKRMVAAVSNRVEALHRSRVGGLSLPQDLASGEWRWLLPDDLLQLSDHSGA